MCLIVIALALQSSEAGCRPEQRSACKEFFARSVDQQEALFRTFPLDRQLEIFRCGMSRRPPTIELAYAIARGGEKIIPELSEALHNEQDEWMQSVIIDIFRVMSNKGYLRESPEVVQQIRATVARMKNSAIKKEAEESVKEIERNGSSGDK